MNNACPLGNFLATATALRIRDFLLEEATDEKQGCDAMKYLLENRPAVANEVLCLVYDIACYQSGATFPDTPAADRDKWFVSVLSGGPFDDGKEIPLADTLEGAHALAVTHLELRKAFFGAEAALA